MNNQDRLEEIALTVQQLSQTVARLVLNQIGGAVPMPQHDRNTEDRTIRIDVPDFGGMNHSPEEYLDWEAELERYFEFKETPVEQRYKLAKIKLNKLAANWFEEVQRQRRREGREGIHTWDKLKEHLRRKYVPSSYKQQLFVQWSTLRQGTRSVADYIQEWERLVVLCNIADSEEMRIGKFIGGLREDLREKLEVMQHLNFDTVCNNALIHEKYAKKRSNYTQPFKLIAPKPSTSSNSMGNMGISTSASNRNINITTPNKPKDRPNAPLKDIICFKCHGHGHIKKECPNSRAFTNMEWTEINERERRPRVMLVAMNGKEEVILPPTPENETEGSYILTNLGTLQRAEPGGSESESEEEVREQLYPEEGRYQLLIQRNFHATPKAKKSDQRESIFQTKCKIKERVCDLIIDGGE